MEEGLTRADGLVQLLLWNAWKCWASHLNLQRCHMPLRTARAVSPGKHQPSADLCSLPPCN